jgi:hypothetical protein
MTDTIEIMGKLERLELKPGDKLILTFPGEISEKQEAQIKSAMEREFPNNRFVVLASGAQLHVVHEDDSDA